MKRSPIKVGKEMEKERATTDEMTQRYKIYKKNHPSIHLSLSLICIANSHTECTIAHDTNT